MKPISSEGNGWYPLPADYPDLTAPGKRAARVNACRLWLLGGGDNLVVSTSFFDWYYLQADLADEFDPGFYDDTFVATPDIHWDISRIWGSTRFSLCIAPRGSAKSTHTRRDLMLRAVSSPRQGLVYATSTHDNAVHTGNLLREQFYENPRIQADFGVLKPVRGTKSTGVHYMHLTNGSWVRCVSAESRLRGIRVHRFKLDDPEYDAAASTSMEKLRENMERFLFSIVIPMATRRRCGVDWLATFVSPRHYAYDAMQTVETDKGVRAADPRFDMWHRLHIKAATRAADGSLVSCWPQMWPASEEEARSLGLSDAMTLPLLEHTMGPQAFRREMLGEMTANEDSYLKLDTNQRGNHAWWFEDVDEKLALDPRDSDTLMCYLHKGEVKRVPLCEWLGQVRLFMTVDTAYTEKASSDRRAALLMAIDSDNVLFGLDLWSAKKSDDALLKAALGMCERWRCPQVFVETVKESWKLFHRFENAVRTRMTQDMGLEWTPVVRPLKPGTLEKSAKIATLDIRFEHNLVKLPLVERGRKPAWTRLFEQIMGFDPDQRDGGIQKDDELDCLSMSLLALRARLKKLPGEEPPPALDVDVLKALREGRTEVSGVPISAVPIDMLDLEVVGELMRAGYTSQRKGSRL